MEHMIARRPGNKWKQSHYYNIKIVQLCKTYKYIWKKKERNNKQQQQQQLKIRKYNKINNI